MTAPADGAAAIAVACALRVATSDPSLVLALVGTAAAHADVTDQDVDEARDMLWFALAGTPDAVSRAVLAAAATAAAIDLGRRRADAPALGAIDRVRISPIHGIDLEGCVAVAEDLARALAAAHDIPIYLTESATPTGAEGRARVLEERGYAGLRATLAAEPDLGPDFGPSLLGPMGAARVGAAPLDARFEIDLDASPSQATRLAGALDGRSGGLADVRAGAVDRQGVAAIAVRLLQPERTTLARVLALADALAPGVGARVLGVRLRGCWAEAALLAALSDSVRTGRIDPRAVWETRLAVPHGTAPEGVRDASTNVAGDEDAEGVGGGAAAAIAAGHAARLAAGIAARSAVRAEGDDTAAMTALGARCASAANTLAALAHADRLAYARAMAAYDLPRGTIEEARARRDGIQDALLDAIEVPLGVIHQSVAVLRALRELAARGDVAFVADCGTSGYVASAAARSGALLVGTQVPGLRDLERGDQLRAQSAELVREADGLAASIDGLVRERMRA